MKKVVMLGLLAAALAAFAASPAQAGVVTVIDSFDGPAELQATPSPGAGSILTPNAAAAGLNSQFFGAGGFGRALDINVDAGGGATLWGLQVSGMPSNGFATAQNGTDTTSQLIISYGSFIGVGNDFGPFDASDLMSISFEIGSDGGGPPNHLLLGSISLQDSGGTVATVPFLQGTTGGSDVRITLSFPAAAFAGVDLSQLTGIQISVQGQVPGVSDDIDLTIDNLQIEQQQIPEPTTMVCLGLGLAAIAGVRCFRRKTRA